ncbi:hypothetical protein QYF36_027169 [Acer negundo]|nr:hypothetical protein QYF36_027169 [Acer negundo]
MLRVLRIPLNGRFTMILIRIEAEARVEGLKKSKQVNKPIGNVKKQGHAQKDGFKGGSKKSECGLANCDGDGDYVKGHKLGNGVSNAVNGKLSLR